MLLSNFVTVLSLAVTAFAGPIPDPISSGTASLSTRADPKDQQIVPFKGQNAVTNGIMRFGIELEQAFRVKDDAHPKLRAFIKKFNDEQDEYNVRRIGRQINQAITEEWNAWDPLQDAELNKEIKLDENFKKYDMADLTGDADEPKDRTKVWIIDEDGSLDMDGSFPSPLFAFEIVSPIMFVGASDAWYGPARQQIEILYYFLSTYMGLELEASKKAGTHVHFSPSSEKFEWTKDRVTGVAAATIYFESAIRSLLPKDRWVNVYAKEYRDWKLKEHWDIPGYADSSDPAKSDDRQVLLQVMNELKYTEGITGIKDLMNVEPPFDDGDISFGNDRYYGWNFLNLAEGGRFDAKALGSIEFRRGPQSLSAEEAMVWVELVTGLALAGCAHGDPQYIVDNFDIQPKDLQEYIYHDWPTPTFDPSKGKFDAVHAYQEGFRYPALDKAFAKVADYDVRGMKLDYNAIYLEDDERAAAQLGPGEKALVQDMQAQPVGDPLYRWAEVNGLLWTEGL